MNRESAVHYGRALSLEREGRYQEAVAAYRETIRLAPGDIEPYIHLGIVLRGLGQDAEANEAFDAVLSLSSRARRV